MTMFDIQMHVLKKLFNFVFVIGLVVCAYWVAYCKPPAPEPVYVKVNPNDDTCAEYVARENQAWLKSLEKTKRNKDAY